MFTECQGITRVLKPWGDFIKSVKHSDKTDMLCLVKINKNTLYVTNGNHVIKISIPQEEEFRPKMGLYYVTQDNCFAPCLDKEIFSNYPSKLDILFNPEGRTKTATLEIPLGRPITAIVCAIEEFDILLNLDMFKKTLTYFGDFDPENVRIYGYEDPEESRINSLLITCNVGRIDISYVMMPYNCKQADIIKVDPEPLLWSKES